MVKVRLPEPLAGEWIWSRANPDKVDSYVFFRREFVLDIGGFTADLLISAQDAYHLYINGRHIAYGPSPATYEMSYADSYDVTPYLEPGANVIAVLGHNVTVPLFSACRKKPGLWCELLLNGRSFLATDARWRVLDASCYAGNRPRRAAGMGFTESVDLSVYPWGWTDTGYNDGGWGRPELIYSHEQLEGGLQALPLDAALCEELTDCVPLIAGSYEKSCFLSQLSFAGIFDGNPAVYAAETHFKWDKDEEIPVRLISDDACKFFCNDQLVCGQGIPDLRSGTDYRLTRGVLYDEAIALGGRERRSLLRLRRGWNRLLLAQQNGSNSMGFSLMFPTLKDGAVHLFREADDDAAVGWRLAGPLRLPLAEATGSLRLGRFKTEAFTPFDININDAASYLDACCFTPGSERDSERVIADGLGSGEYIIFDLGEIHYGFPRLLLSGSQGDVVDVTWGERIIDNRVPSLGQQGRSTDTLILQDGGNAWTGFSPRGANFLMLSVRRCAERVGVEHVTFMRRGREYESRTFFDCSDERISEIWETGLKTLQATVADVFMDSPCGRQNQYVAGAMIQALASAYAFGDYDISEKALREFALAQFENGNIPAHCPSSFYYAIPDFALLWPVWLQHHCHLSGNAKFREEMIPHLNALLDFFRTLAGKGGLLCNLHEDYRLEPYIDRGVAVHNGVLTALNAMYLRCLLSSADIYDGAERREEAEACRKTAAQVREAVRGLVYDSESGLFRDAFADDQADNEASLQTNILAAYSGLAGKDDFQTIFNAFFNAAAQSPFEKQKMVSTPYFKYFILEALFAYGKSEWALDYLKYYWGTMLDFGATTWWSVFEPEMEREDVINTQFCHGYGVSPNIFLIRELAGIRLAQPGFTQIYFDPVLTAADWVKVSMPTPYGRINLFWEKVVEDGYRIQIDANYPLGVIPCLSPELMEQCTFEFGPNVGVVQS